MKKIWSVAAGLAILLAFTLIGSAGAGSSSHYTIGWQLFSGGTTQSAGDITLTGSLGQTAAGLSSGGIYGFSSGYWVGNGTLNSRLFLPQLTLNYTPPVQGPDLLVERIVVSSSNTIQVVVKNGGNAPVTADDEFWVDVYIDPSHKPAYNQPWNTIAGHGGAWGVTSPALPLEENEVITLTTGGTYYWPDLSDIDWPLAAGTTIYAQVDSADSATSYGAVRESNELNNVSSAVLTTSLGSGLQSAAIHELELAISRGVMPDRPD